jgi:Cu/Ag efflux pump CusA
VFVSVFFLQGAARYLFTPLAMAVVFVMFTSYCLSRALTPIMIGLLIRTEYERHVLTQAGLHGFTRILMRSSTNSAISMAGCSAAFSSVPS